MQTSQNSPRGDLRTVLRNAFPGFSFGFSNNTDVALRAFETPDSMIEYMLTAFSANSFVSK